LNIKNSSDTDDLSIRNLQIIENEIFTYANQVPLIQKITIKPKVIARELYEIILPIKFKTYDLTCKNNNPSTYVEKPFNVLTFNITDDVTSLRIQIGAFFNEKLVIRKTAVNYNGEYIQNSFNDSSYSPQKNFTSFYNSKTINYVNSTQDSFSLLFFLDNPIEKKTSYNMDCTIFTNDKSINSIIYKVNLIQSTSNKLDGYFVLKIKDEFDNIYKTENIPSTKWDIIDYLNKIPYLVNHVQVLKINPGLEMIYYIIRLDFNVIVYLI